MNSLRFYKNPIGGIFLLIFLFSANSLLYKTHFVEEFGHNGHSIAFHSDGSDSAITSLSTDSYQQQAGGQGAHHENGTPCCESHSHASILYQPISYSYSPRMIAYKKDEPFRFIPEVYLDKFIPPQNLA
jgi:hypothetical protein